MRAPRIAKLSAAFALAALPLLAAAATTQIIDGTKNADDYSWKDGSNSIFGMFGTIMELLIGIASVLAAMFFMYGGFLYLTSAGDTAKISKAHEIFKNVGWGFVLLLSAWLIVVSILQALEADTWLLDFFGADSSSSSSSCTDGTC